LPRHNFILSIKLLLPWISEVDSPKFFQLIKLVWKISMEILSGFMERPYFIHFISGFSAHSQYAWELFLYWMQKSYLMQKSFFFLSEVCHIQNHTNLFCCTLEHLCTCQILTIARPISVIHQRHVIFIFFIGHFTPLLNLILDFYWNQMSYLFWLIHGDLMYYIQLD
jgi:hypothetical protein